MKTPNKPSPKVSDQTPNQKLEEAKMLIMDFQKPLFEELEKFLYRPSNRNKHRYNIAGLIDDLLTAQDLISREEQKKEMIEDCDEAWDYGYARGREEQKKADAAVIDTYPNIYIAQERAMAPGCGGEFPDTVAINKLARLKKIPKGEIQQKILNPEAQQVLSDNHSTI